MRRSRAPLAFALACAALPHLSACRDAERANPPGGAGPLVARLARVDPVARSLEARTSIATAYAPCTIPDSLPAAARCPHASPPASAIVGIAAAGASLVRDSLAADALHASALIDLVWGDTAGNALSRSLQSLGQAARYERSAAAWSDLAAAELARADRTDDPRARLSALEAAARAVRADSSSLVACFNLALAAERLGLDGRAREEWMRYLALERDEGWRAEARARIAAIDAREVPSVAGTMSPAIVERLADRDPAALRLHAFTDDLAAWSDARLRLDDGAARAAASRIRRAGDAMARLHGDSTLLDIARELDAGSPPATVRAVAAFSAGQRAAAGGRYAVAESLFARGRTADAPPTVAAWSRAFEAIQQVFTGDVTRARAGLERAVAEARLRRRPALEARAGWTLAIVLLRGNQKAQSDAVLARVEELSRRLGDRETVAMVATARSEDLYLAGDSRTAARLALSAMSTLRSYRRSVRLHNALYRLALTADDRELSAAGAVIHDEDALVARATGHADFYADALIAAARSRLVQGDTAGAVAGLREVERSLAGLPAGDPLRWLAALAAHVRSATGAQGDDAALDSAVAFFEARDARAMKLDALVARGLANADRDPARAERDLAAALAMLADRGSTRWRSDAERRAMGRSVRKVADRLVMVYLHQSRAADALAALERGRGDEHGTDARPMPGTVILDFLLTGDTLVAWRITSEGRAVSRDIVSRRAVAFAGEELRRSAESGAMDRSVLAMLYDKLLRRHGSALRAASQLVVVADEELAGLPFAALYDTSGAGAYVVERASVQVVPRLSDARREPWPAVRRPLFVADPAFDPSVFPGLGRLPGTRAEADASRRFYPASTLLAGREATTGAVSAAMRSADLVHLGSHALFDVERPEESRLLLAPDEEARTGLTARTISSMTLRGVRLAVLSSCESTRSGVADAPLTVGLAQAFHDAGVPGVVGALWRVDDAATGELMTELHRGISATRDPVRALRTAQLALLRDAHPARRDPAAWGAFVFTGR